MCRTRLLTGPPNRPRTFLYRDHQPAGSAAHQRRQRRQRPLWGGGNRVVDILNAVVDGDRLQPVRHRLESGYRLMNRCGTAMPALSAIVTAASTFRTLCAPRSGMMYGKQRLQVRRPPPARPVRLAICPVLDRLPGADMCAAALAADGPATSRQDRRHRARRYLAPGSEECCLSLPISIHRAVPVKMIRRHVENGGNRRAAIPQLELEAGKLLDHKIAGFNRVEILR
jgi:hypothetical protein